MKSEKLSLTLPSSFRSIFCHFLCNFILSYYIFIKKSDKPFLTHHLFSNCSCLKTLAQNSKLLTGCRADPAERSVAQSLPKYRSMSRHYFSSSFEAFFFFPLIISIVNSFASFLKSILIVSPSCNFELTISSAKGSSINF